MRFLEDHMRVRSAEAEGADAGNRGPAVFRQRFEGNLIRSGRASRSTWGFGREKFRLAGIARWWRARPP